MYKLGFKKARGTNAPSYPPPAGTYVYSIKNIKLQISKLLHCIKRCHIINIGIMPQKFVTDYIDDFLKL